MIKFYDASNVLLGTTSKSISRLHVVQELERAWTAQIELPLNHPCAPYVTENNSVQIDGQMYDIVSLTEYTGEQNYIACECEHRSYRLNDVMVEMFTNLGTAKQNLQKLLEGTSFTAGDVPTTGVEAFSIANAVTIRNAIYQLAHVHGWEVKWNNHVVNLVDRLGADRGKVFEYRRDLKNIVRSVDKRQKDDSGAYKTSYDVELCSLYRSGQGTEADYFELGDDVTVQDEIAGKTLKTRIVKYERDYIDPSQDRLELNNIVSDIYDDTINLITDIDSRFYDTSNDIDNLTDEVRQSLKEGQKYNNVSISKQDGFVAERLSDGLKTLLNAYDCIKIQKSDGTIIFQVDDSGEIVTRGEFTSTEGEKSAELRLGGLFFRLQGNGVAAFGPTDDGLYITGYNKPVTIYPSAEISKVVFNSLVHTTTGKTGITQTVTVSFGSKYVRMVFSGGILTGYEEIGG